MLQQLWAPLRLAYVASAKPPADGDPCFICQGLAEVVYLNRFPYNNGHLLVAPRAHKGRLDDLLPDEIVDTQQTLQRMVRLLDELMHPEGYNIGLNLGRVAGAGLPGHLHWHMVPRWNGDTNFMPVIGDTKVLVQSLEALFDLMRQRLATGEY